MDERISRTIRFTSEEYKKIKEAAIIMGVSINTFIIAACNLHIEYMEEMKRSREFWLAVKAREEMNDNE